MSLFQKAEKHAKRLKMYVYGETGTGKTVTSLHFPKVALVDTERGTDHYGEHFDFHRIQTADPAKVHEAIDELLIDPNGFKTFVIDPIINVYENIIDFQLRRQRVKHDNPGYELQPRDYKFIKSEIKNLIKKLLSLDMNIIVTAPSRPVYSSDTTEFMKVIGTDAEGPKQLPFMFDVVLELTTDGEGNHTAVTKKDRTNKLPKEFAFNFKSFADYLGIEGLSREAVVFNQKQDLESRSERRQKITYKGKELFTAGITSESLDKLEFLAGAGLEELLMEKLRADYYLDSILDLRDDEAISLIDDLKEHNQTNK